MSKKFLIIIGLLVIGMIALLKLDSDKPTAKLLTPNQALQAMVGKPAPGFALASYDGKTYSLDQFRGKKVVLFFNEGIMCYPACWNQIAALGRDPLLNNAQVATLSVVTDNRGEWVEAIHRMPDLGKETILLDPTTKVSAKYNTLSLPSSMHKGSKPGHTYLLVDAKGVVRYVFDDDKMGIHNEQLIKELAKI